MAATLLPPSPRPEEQAVEEQAVEEARPRQRERPQQPRPAAHGEAEPTREREERLRARRPALVRHEGQLAEVRDDLLSADALLRSFTQATDVLAEAGLDFAPMPGREPRHRVAIAPGRRAEVLAALAAGFAGQPVYADLLGHDVTLSTVLAERLPQAVTELERPWAEQKAAEEAAEGEADEPEAGPDITAGQSPVPSRAPETAPAVVVKGVRIYRPVVTSGRTLFYGPEHGCDLEFWDSAAPSPGAIAAIHEPPFGWWVPSLAPESVVRIGAREYPTAAAFTQPLLSDVTFPVDAVITWVDDTDPAWRRKRDTARLGLPRRPSTGDGQERFHNRDELRYCLRSIAMYAPWIRHVFLVTDEQVPSWLRTDHPGLTVVPHRELFADPSVLPVFNSHAIESQLHRVPGLAEHFLYFNDDMFLGCPVRPEQFFQGNGAPLVTLDARVIPPGEVGPGDDEYVAAQKNTRALVRREFGRHTTNALSHAPYPLTRGLLQETAASFAAELAATSRSVFRSREDLAPITLAVGIGYLTRRVAFGRIGHRYVDVDRYAALEQLPGLLRDRGVETFCLNDGALDHVPRAEQDRIVTEFLRDYFPVPGPFELCVPVPSARPGEEPVPQSPDGAATAVEPARTAPGGDTPLPAQVGGRLRVG